MERFGISYVDIHRVVICQDHGYALSLSSLKRHLQRLHAAKREELRAAMTEVQDLELLYLPDEITQPPPGQPPIRGLTLSPGFKCSLGACNQETESMSTFRLTVEKHLARVYSVGRLKPTKPIPAMIEQVWIQSFFTPPHYRPFVVVPNTPFPSGIQSNLSLLDANSAEQNRLTKQLELEYTSSRQAWKEAFAYLPTGSEQYQSQVLPWLKTTGISLFLEDLSQNKDSLRAFVTPPATRPAGKGSLYAISFRIWLTLLKEKDLHLNSLSNNVSICISSIFVI